jgi:signal-transduction protein with cAMP-binding, CBS, and nucleotidyltransferase domain
MSHPLITIGSNENVLKAYELMMQKGIGRLVVLEDGKIVGRIRLEDIKHLASETPITVFYRVGYFLLGVLVTLVGVALALAL